MEPFALIIFGITGNLAQIKLIPALYDLEEKGLLPSETTIMGIARREMDEEQFKTYIKEVLAMENKHHMHDTKPEIVEKLLSRMSYLQGDFETNEDDRLYTKLKLALRQKEAASKNHLYYLATYPNLYAMLFEALQRNGLNRQENGWVRLMIEKPIGHDYKSAVELDTLLHKYFTEDQIFRLDHYLGKETTKNILVFRFGNELWQPLMNHKYIDHIQIVAAEDFGIGRRGGYYDTVGAFRDVGQNHLLQMLAVATMDCPTEFANYPVTNERIKILQSLKAKPQDIVFGQYNGYLYEEKVKPDSKADTFFALKLEIENETWRGIPIYIRAGKRLPKTVTEISIVFKTPTAKLFEHSLAQLPNVLTYRVQPNEGIGLELLAKRPGEKFALERDYMQFCYHEKRNEIADAYVNLLYDAICGDATFFNDAPEVEAAWKFVDGMRNESNKPLIYEPGTWGPEEANKLIEKDGRKWLEPNDVLCRI